MGENDDKNPPRGEKNTSKLFSFFPQSPATNSSKVIFSAQFFVKQMGVEYDVIALRNYFQIVPLLDFFLNDDLAAATQRLTLSNEKNLQTKKGNA